MLNDMRSFMEICKRYQSIYVYGAGRNAKHIYQFLIRRDIKISGFIVSEKTDNPNTLYCLPVYDVKEFDYQGDVLILVSIFTYSSVYKEIFDIIQKYNLCNVYFFQTKLLTDIKNDCLTHDKKHRVQLFCDRSDYYIPQTQIVESMHTIFAMKDTNGLEYHWRLNDSIFLEDNWNQTIQDLFPIQTPLEEFEHQYGKYHVFQSLGVNPLSTNKTYRIYMSKSHVDKPANIPCLPEWITPIQVGTALTDIKICDLTDAQDDNISERNSIYSECTAIYWMWKNAPKTDYIGLCHYRRHFDIPNNEINRMEGAGIDVLVTAPTFVNEGVEEFLLTFVPHSDFKVFRSAIQNVQPDYMETAEAFLKSRFYPPCNLFLMKYELFQKYAEFVFSVTFEIERVYNERNFMRNDRYMGYLVECLLGIFLMKHKEELKIAYTDMKFYE